MKQLAREEGWIFAIGVTLTLLPIGLFLLGVICAMGWTVVSGDFSIWNGPIYPMVRIFFGLSLPMIVGYGILCFAPFGYGRKATAREDVTVRLEPPKRSRVRAVICRLRRHQWLYLTPGEDQMGGVFAPRRCMRCGERSEGIPRPGCIHAFQPERES